MGAMLSSELATRAQGTAAATAPRIQSQVCRGTECTGEQHGQPRTLSGPQQTLVLGCLPEKVLRRGLQRPSLRVKAGEGPGGTRRMGQREHPTFS